jgi:hypothetical protein
LLNGVKFGAFQLNVVATRQLHYEPPVRLVSNWLQWPDLLSIMARTPRPKVAGSSASSPNLRLSTSAETCAVEIVVSVRGIESATSVTLEEKLMEACETSFLD